jgi:hypothetical protein
MAIEATTEQIAAATAHVLAGHHGAGRRLRHPRSVLAPVASIRTPRSVPATPAPGTDRSADRRMLQALGIGRAVLVHSSVYGPDNGATTDALVEMAGRQGSPTVALVSARSWSTVPPGFTDSRRREFAQRS